jgi:hypothetical protein
VQLARSVVAANPKAFGRGPVRDVGEPEQPARISDDLRLFAATFLAGFIFVSVLIG